MIGNSAVAQWEAGEVCDSPAIDFMWDVIAEGDTNEYVAEDLEQEAFGDSLAQEFLFAASSYAATEALRKVLSGVKLNEREVRALQVMQSRMVKLEALRVQLTERRVSA